MRASLVAGCSLLGLVSVGCGAPSTSADVGTDASASIVDAGTDAASHDTASVDAPDTPSDVGPALVTGFTFDGPRTPAPPPTGTSYVLSPPTGTGTPGAMLGSPCAIGDDCTSLGPYAACLRKGTSGFCTIDCDMDPEGPSVLCPMGSYCFVGMRPDGGRVCLPSCTSDGECPSGELCSGSLFTFNIAETHAHVCLPPCASDADCNADSSGFVCDTTHHRCASPREELGRACTSNADCLGVGPGGTCMRSTRDPSASYCTLACDPASASACGLGGGSGGTLGPCVEGYASATDGTGVPVCLGACSSDAQCQLASSNTCSYLPSTGTAVCTIACTSDADCIDGTCDVASGDCQQAMLFSPRCASDSNCAAGLCVTDFHHAAQHDCSQRCTTDAECPSASVCVTSPDALDGSGEHLPYAGGPGDQGFCAPTCTPDAGVCSDPSTRCLMPAARPEIDFAGSGAASHAFCWI